MNPETVANNVKKLTGRDDFRLRVGDWRILFYWDEGALIVTDVLPRGSAYD